LGGTVRNQAIMGINSPLTSEARLSYRWPSVARFAAPARLGSSIIGSARALIFAVIRMPLILSAVLILPATILGFLIAFVAYMLLAPLYFSKVLPFLMTKYVLTNRRVMITKGWSQTPTGEVALENIEAVRVVPGSEQSFYLAADLEIISEGKVALTLHGTPEPEHFKINIENAFLAWGRKDPPKDQAFSAATFAKK
jgi:hypothetical protein